MGLFGGKKKNAETAATTGSDRVKQQPAQKSRRVLVPGGAGKPQQPPAAPPTPARPAAQAPAAPAKPGTARTPAAPQAENGHASAPKSGPRPAVKPAAEPPKPSPSKPLMIGGDRTPAGGASGGRPPSRQPITESKPPEFAGGLGSAARGGPCRTGDNALIEFLIGKAHLLTAEQAENVRKKANQDNLPIDSAAVHLGFLSEEQLVNALTQECWVPHLRVDKYEIRKKALDTIARDDATHYGVFPVDKLGSLLTLAMVNPLDAETIRVLEAKTSLDIKKVVATRTEIAQGIEKYYSGQVQAKDTSLSFTQDAEQKSVTQMLSKVQVSDAPKPPAPPKPAAAKPPAPPPQPPRAPSMPPPGVGPSKIKTPAPSIVPEIEDIDDLLAGDEVIAPAIIEPASIEPVAIEPDSIEPLEPEPLVKNEALAPIISPEPVAPAATVEPPKPVPQPAPQPAKAPAPELLDLDVDLALPPVAPAAKATPPAPVPEPAKPAPAAAKPPAPAPAPAVAKPAAPAPLAAVPPPAAKPATPARPAAPPKPATPASSGAHRTSGTGTTSRAGTRSVQRPSAAPAVVNLIPVMEEEFQHAITHGKAHVFEKWVSLQSRNRIINGVVVEEELDEVLAGLYAGAKPIG